MSDLKISQLSTATALVGTEVLPVVQGGATVKVAVSNLIGTAIPANGVYVAGTNTVGIATNSTNRVTVDASGNVGIGVTPSAWAGNSSKGLDIGNWAGFGLRGDTSATVVTGNAYYLSGNYKYKISSWPATAYECRAPSGVHAWLSAGSGTADATITFTQAMTLHASGGLSLGNTTDPGAGIMSFAATKGVAFTANTPAAGMASQLLNWYETGTWTPTQGAGLTVVGAFSSTGRYTRIGQHVFVTGVLTGATTVAAAAGNILTAGLPFTTNTAGTGIAVNATTSASAMLLASTTSTTIYSSGAIAASGNISFSLSYIA